MAETREESEIGTATGMTLEGPEPAHPADRHVRESDAPAAFRTPPGDPGQTSSIRRAHDRAERREGSAETCTPRVRRT